MVSVQHELGFIPNERLLVLESRVARAGPWREIREKKCRKEAVDARPWQASITRFAEMLEAVAKYTPASSFRLGILRYVTQRWASCPCYSLLSKKKS